VPGPPRFVEASRSNSDTPHSVGLLWTREQLVAETSTWQHTTVTTDRHPCPRWDFFFCPVFSFDPFCTFKSFRPSCHFTFHTTVLIQQTQHKHPCPRRDIVFGLSGVFSPLIHFCTVLNHFVLHVTYVPYYRITQHKHPCSRWHSNPRSQWASGRRPTL
jgi:hypothetical protein